MSVVAIVGAGTLGGAIAHAIASRDRFHEVRLIDEARDIAAGKALDIQQAAPVECFRTAINASEDVAAAADADVAILAGPASGETAEFGDDAGLAVIERLAAGVRCPVVICAGASHRSLVERGVRECGLPRRGLIGSAPEALRAALSALLALDIGCAASDVALTVLGVPPRRAVVPWSQVTVAGLSVERRLSVARLARVRARTTRLWPPGPYALAAAAGRVAASLVDRTGRTPVCFAVLEGELGVSRRSAAVPVELDALGIARVVEPSLSTYERVQLDNALRDQERAQPPS